MLTVIRVPLHVSVSFISSISTVIFLNNRYLDLSVAFFQTQLYLLALASNFDPSMYRCCRSTCSSSNILWLISEKISSMDSFSISLMKYPNVRYDGVSRSIRYMNRRLTLQLSSSSLREQYPLVMNPKSTVFSILTGSYLKRPVRCSGTFFRYFLQSIPSMNRSNVKTGSNRSKQSERNTGKNPCLGLE